MDFQRYQQQVQDTRVGRYQEYVQGPHYIKKWQRSNLVATAFSNALQDVGYATLKVWDKFKLQDDNRQASAAFSQTRKRYTDFTNGLAGDIDYQTHGDKYKEWEEEERTGAADLLDGRALEFYNQLMDTNTPVWYEKTTTTAVVDGRTAAKSTLEADIKIAAQSRDIREVATLLRVGREQGFWNADEEYTMGREYLYKIQTATLEESLDEMGYSNAIEFLQKKDGVAPEEEEERVLFERRDAPREGVVNLPEGAPEELFEERMEAETRREEEKAKDKAVEAPGILAAEKEAAQKAAEVGTPEGTQAELEEAEQVGSYVNAKFLTPADRATLVSNLQLRRDATESRDAVIDAKKQQAYVTEGLDILQEQYYTDQMSTEQAMNMIEGLKERGLNAINADVLYAKMKNPVDQPAETITPEDRAKYWKFRDEIKVSNDPAIRAAIYDQVKQMFIENRIPYTMVTAIEQILDGKTNDQISFGNNIIDALTVDQSTKERLKASWENAVLDNGFEVAGVVIDGDAATDKEMQEYIINYIDAIHTKDRRNEMAKIIRKDLEAYKPNKGLGNSQNVDWFEQTNRSILEGDYGGLGFMYEKELDDIHNVLLRFATTEMERAPDSMDIDDAGRIFFWYQAGRDPKGGQYWWVDSDDAPRLGLLGHKRLSMKPKSELAREYPQVVAPQDPWQTGSYVVSLAGEYVMTEEGTWQTLTNLRHARKIRRAGSAILGWEFYYLGANGAEYRIGEPMGFKTYYETEAAARAEAARANEED